MMKLFFVLELIFFMQSKLNYKNIVLNFSKIYDFTTSQFVFVKLPTPHYLWIGKKYPYFHAYRCEASKKYL